MTSEPSLPEDPRARLVELCQEIAAHKRWFQDWSMLRYAATGLLSTAGEPAQLVARLYADAEELKEGAGWFSGLRTDLRFCFVGALMRHGFSVPHFLSLLERTREHFRAVGLPRGELQEALACLVLMAASGGDPDRSQVEAIARVVAAMREQHPFLTGADDYPAAALLATSGDSIGDLVKRIERLYEGLRDLDFKRGNQLQLASHLLYFAPDPDDVLLHRFRGLYEGFQGEGLYMNSGDYDEVAMLAFLDQDPRRVVQRVLADRDELRARLSPKPSKQQGFTLATNTAFLHLVTRDREGQRGVDAVHLAQVFTLLQAQQAAMAAAASAAATAS